MRAILASVVVLVLAGFAGAADDEKIDAKKLIGKWEYTEKGKDGGLTFEFADQGKCSITLKFGKESAKFDGTYKVNGNKIETEVDFEGKPKKDTFTVTKLTDTELKLKDNKDKGEELPLKKVK